MTAITRTLQGTSPAAVASAVATETTNRQNDTATRVVKLTRATPITAVGPTTVAVNTIVPCDTTSNSVGITLPTAPAEGSRIYLKHIATAGTNSVTITCGGSDVFNKTAGGTTKTLVLLNQAINLQYTATGAIWTVTAEDQPLLATDARYVPFIEAINTVASAGPTRTLAVTSTASVNDITLTENCTITLPASTPGNSCTLVLRQGGTGSYAVTFSPVPKWSGGNAPVLSTAVGSVDILSFVYVTAWNGFIAGQAMA